MNTTGHKWRESSKHRESISKSKQYLPFCSGSKEEDRHNLRQTFQIFSIKKFIKREKTQTIKNVQVIKQTLPYIF